VWFEVSGDPPHNGVRLRRRLAGGCVGTGLLPALLQPQRSMVRETAVAPATNYGRFSCLPAYAQAADQHVWSGLLRLWGQFVGDLLSPCVCSRSRVAPTRAASTLRFRCRGADRAKRCIGMPCECRCNCPTQSDSGFWQGDLAFARDGDGHVEGHRADGGRLLELVAPDVRGRARRSLALWSRSPRSSQVCRLRCRRRVRCLRARHAHQASSCSVFWLVLAKLHSVCERDGVSGRQ
jgi:hypothetical protein